MRRVHACAVVALSSRWESGALAGLAARAGFVFASATSAGAPVGDGAQRDRGGVGEHAAREGDGGERQPMMARASGRGDGLDAFAAPAAAPAAASAPVVSAAARRAAAAALVDRVTRQARQAKTGGAPLGSPMPVDASANHERQAPGD